MREVWPDTFVEEANISRHIWTLRRALGDESLMETQPRRGYRLKAPVREPASPGTHQKPRRRSPGEALVALGHRERRRRCARVGGMVIAPAPRPAATRWFALAETSRAEGRFRDASRSTGGRSKSTRSSRWPRAGSPTPTALFASPRPVTPTRFAPSPCVIAPPSASACSSTPPITRCSAIGRGKPTRCSSSSGRIRAKRRRTPPSPPSTVKPGASSPPSIGRERRRGSTPGSPTPGAGGPGAGRSEPLRRCAGRCRRRSQLPVGGDARHRLRAGVHARRCDAMRRELEWAARSVNEDAAAQWQAQAHDFLGQRTRGVRCSRAPRS